jgi:hypothetical protein
VDGSLKVLERSGDAGGGGLEMIVRVWVLLSVSPSSSLSLFLSVCVLASRLDFGASV